MKYIIFSLCLFFLGFLCGRLSIDAVIVSTEKTLTAQSRPAPQQAIQPVTPSELAPPKKGLNPEPARSLIPESLPDLIDFIPDESMASVIALFISSDDVDEIEDPSIFAKRYLEEMNLNSHAIDSESYSVLTVTSSKESSFDESLLKLNHSDRVYAHINFSNGLATGSNKIMSRWVNMDTSEVLFFEKSDIRGDSDNNWVSFTPSGGWKTGSYEVTFYQFGSELKKLASKSFYVSVEP